MTRVHILRSHLFPSSKLTQESAQQLCDCPTSVCSLSMGYGNYCKCSHIVLLSEGRRTNQLPCVLLTLCRGKLSLSPGGWGTEAEEPCSWMPHFSKQMKLLKMELGGLASGVPCWWPGTISRSLNSDPGYISGARGTKYPPSRIRALI